MARAYKEDLEDPESSMIIELTREEYVALRRMLAETRLVDIPLENVISIRDIQHELHREPPSA